MAVRKGITGSRCVDTYLRKIFHEEDYPQLPGAGRLAPSFDRITGDVVVLPKDITDAINLFGLFEMVAGSRFDAEKSLLALERSYKV